MSTTSRDPASNVEVAEAAHGHQPGARGRRMPQLPWLKLTPVTGSYSVAVIIGVVSTVASSSFLTGHNMANIVQQGAPLVVVALGETVVILAGGLDVSVGSVVTLSSVVGARVMNSEPSMVIPTILLVLGLALIVGFANGFMIGYLRADAFVTTLASMLVVNGAALVYSQGSPANNLTHGFLQISAGTVFGIPVGVFIVLGAMLLMWALLKRTVWGQRIYAIGANPRVATLTGQPVARTILAGYVLCALLAGAGGLMFLAFEATGDINAGQGWELNAIAAVLIGGTVFGGGKGGIAGTLAGAIVLTVLYNLFGLLALSDWVQYITQGLVVVAGVALYSRRIQIIRR